MVVGIEAHVPSSIYGPELYHDIARSKTVHAQCKQGLTTSLYVCKGMSIGVCPCVDQKKRRGVQCIVGEALESMHPSQQH